METAPPTGWIEEEGDIVPADHIRFVESVWLRGKRVGDRTVWAEVLEAGSSSVLEQWPKAEASDDWVYCQNIKAEGFGADDLLFQFRRQRKNVYRNGLLRRLWDDETVRAALLNGMA